MGLDYAFYRQDEIEVLRFRNHSEFLDMFTAEPLVQLEMFSSHGCINALVQLLPETGSTVTASVTTDRALR